MGRSPGEEMDPGNHVVDSSRYDSSLYKSHNFLYRPADLDCPNSTEVLSSTTLDVLPESENITTPCNNEYWRATTGKTGEESEIILDLKCPKRLDTFSIMNGFGDFGLKKYSLMGSKSLDDPWTELYSGELPPGLEMTEEVVIYITVVIIFLLSGYQLL